MDADPNNNAFSDEDQSLDENQFSEGDWGFTCHKKQEKEVVSVKKESHQSGNLYNKFLEDWNSIGQYLIYNSDDEFKNALLDICRKRISGELTLNGEEEIVISTVGLSHNKASAIPQPGGVHNVNKKIIHLKRKKDPNIKAGNIENPGAFATFFGVVDWVKQKVKSFGDIGEMFSINDDNLKETMTWGSFQKKWDKTIFHEQLPEFVHELRQVLQYNLQRNIYYVKDISENGPSISIMKIGLIPFFVNWPMIDKDSGIIKITCNKLELPLLCETFKDWLCIEGTVIIPYTDPNKIKWGKEIYTVDDIKKKYFNMFRGFKAKVLNKRMDEILAHQGLQKVVRHIREVWCGEDENNNNDSSSRWVLSWFKTMFFDPGVKTEKSLVLNGDQGIGKGILAHWLINHVFGKYHSTYIGDFDKITQRFNSIGEGKVFVFVDELQCSEGKKAAFTKFKGLVTEQRKTVERKGIDCINVPDFANYLLVSNFSDSVFVEKTDRRFVITDTSTKFVGNKEYFDALAAVLNQETADYFATFLNHFDGVNVRDVKNIPNTRAKQEAREASMSPVELFCKACEKGEVDLETEGITSGTGVITRTLEGKERKVMVRAEIYSVFQHWMDRNGFNYKVNQNSFLTGMRAYLGPKYVTGQLRMNHERPYFIDIEPLLPQTVDETL